jgi:hypothetical protein
VGGESAMGQELTPLTCANHGDGPALHNHLRARFFDPTTSQLLTRGPMVATTRSPYAYGRASDGYNVNVAGLSWGLKRRRFPGQLDTGNGSGSG